MWSNRIHVLSFYKSQYEKFEDTKGVIVSRKSEDRQYKVQKKKDKTLRRKLKIDPHLKPIVNSVAVER
jgi:hypothetical protein